ncbi:hypothetical protein C2E23DRAFT_886391 [Lenzites betulinus]|nr:hypothetical protein C2E23DRAFT_886391 [Lenzites betulinus]
MPQLSPRSSERAHTVATFFKQESRNRIYAHPATFSLQDRPLLAPLSAPHRNLYLNQVRGTGPHLSSLCGLQFIAIPLFTYPPRHAQERLDKLSLTIPHPTNSRTIARVHACDFGVRRMLVPSSMASQDCSDVRLVPTRICFLLDTARVQLCRVDEESDAPPCRLLCTEDDTDLF